MRKKKNADPLGIIGAAALAAEPDGDARQPNQTQNQEERIETDNPGGQAMRTYEAKRSVALGLLTLLMGFMLGAPYEATSGPASVRTVRGEVVAVVTDEQPQVIVVKSVTAGKGALVVGATLDSETVVSRAKKRVSLSEIRVGETVTLAYLIGPDGPAAKAIHAR
jgi:hypothetical protein